MFQQLPLFTFIPVSPPLPPSLPPSPPADALGSSRSVPGKMYEVKEYFLEDVLRETGFSSPEMARAKVELRTQQALSSWTEHASDRPLAGSAAATDRPSIPAPILGQQTEVQSGRGGREGERGEERMEGGRGSVGGEGSVSGGGEKRTYV